MSDTLDLDAVIIGAGVAGLWLHYRLRKAGYRCILLEKSAPGGQQSLHSQGIIHGGTKYSLNGALSSATNAIADMPARWQACIEGKGEVDLSAATVSSTHHYMWSKERLTSKLTAFFASRALGNRIRKKTAEHKPKAFDHPDFHGNFYALEELVLDIDSVIRCLRAPFEDSLFRYDCLKPETFKGENGQIDTILLSHRQNSIRIRPGAVILAAGEGNESLLHAMNLNAPSMQRRPLHMVFVRHEYPHPVYAHCIGTGSKPLITITTHFDSHGRPVWYLGGNLAETGVELSSSEQIRSAQTLLKDILPWIDLGQQSWHSFLINRAEPRQNALTRPDSAYVHKQGNLLTTWPTKLALTPNLADEVFGHLPPPAHPAGDNEFLAPLRFLPPAPASVTPWETCFENASVTSR